MSFTVFLVYEHLDVERRLDAREADTLAQRIGAIPRLTGARLYTPDAASDPFLNDGPPPALAAQLYFAALSDLEASAAEDGPLARLLDVVQSLTGASGTQEAMAVRRFAVPEPLGESVATYCTYLVAYAGPAEDPNAWHAHYLAHHPPAMAQLPGIRELEIYTPVEYVSGLPWPREANLQRNKVAFDSAAALTAALHSPVREAMRTDFKAFPPFRGKVTHFPMATRRIGR